MSFDPIETVNAEDDWYFDNDMNLEDQTEYTQEEIDSTSAIV